MAIKKPVVISTGQLEQLQFSDTISTSDLTDSLDKRFVNDTQLALLVTGSGGVVTVLGTPTEGQFAKFLSENVVSGITGSSSTVTESDIVLSDVITNDVSISKHGFTPKLSNVVNQFLNGQGGWSIPTDFGANQLISTLPSGTAPFSIISTTVNPNLNADMLDGYHILSGTAGQNLQIYDANNLIGVTPTAGSGIVSGVLSSDIDTAAQMVFKTKSGKIMGMLEYGTISGTVSAFSTLDVATNFISTRVFNAIWNDIAECFPSDGNCIANELVQIDEQEFQLKPYDGDFDKALGINSPNPGMIVGYNKKYKNPIFIVLKGMAWFNCNPIKFKYKIGDCLYLTRKGIMTGIQVKNNYLNFTDCKKLGIIIEIKEDMVRLFV